MDEGNGGPTPKFGSSGTNITGSLQPKSLTGKEADRSSQSQNAPPGPSRHPGEYVAHTSSFKEGQLSDKGISPSGTGHHGNTSQGLVPPKHTSGDKRIVIENVADIPLPSQAPPPTMRPRLTLPSAPVPASPPLPSARQTSTPVKPPISFKIEQRGLRDKSEGNRSATGAISSSNIKTSAITVKSQSSMPKVNTPCTLTQPQRSSIIIGPSSMKGSSRKFLPTQVPSSKDTTLNKKPILSESDVTSKLTSVDLTTTNTPTHTRSEGLSSLVSYSSSSSEGSPSECNPHDDQDESSLSSILDESVDTSSNNSQYTGAVTKLMAVKSFMTPECMEKVISEKLEAVDTSTAEKHADASDSKFPDAGKQHSTYSTPSKAGSRDINIKEKQVLLKDDQPTVSKDTGIIKEKKEILSKIDHSTVSKDINVVKEKKEVCLKTDHSTLKKDNIVKENKDLHLKTNNPTLNEDTNIVKEKKRHSFKY